MLGGPVEVDHVQVSVGEGVLRYGWWAGLNAGILRVVVRFIGLGGWLLPLGQVQVCICDVIVVLDLNEIEKVILEPLPVTTGTKSGCSVSSWPPLAQP